MSLVIEKKLLIVKNIRNHKFEFVMWHKEIKILIFSQQI